MSLLRLLIPLLFICSLGYSQKYTAKDGLVSFFSEAPVENIKADNNDVISVLMDNGTVAFTMLNKDFSFPKKLMQEHFNDKYMESHKFPRSTFSGTISGFSIKGAGIQSVRATGRLSIHGITQTIDVPGTIEVKRDVIILKSKFRVLTTDYGISIPKLMWKNISEELEITVDITYKINQN